MRNKMFCVITVLIALSIGCNGVTQNTNLAGLHDKPNKLPQSGPSPISPDPETLCHQVPEIRVLPFKGDKGRDRVYDSLVTAGDAVVPCLIDEITNLTHMSDPRETPKFADTRVGDVAYFVFTDITKMNFTDPLPPNVKEEYKADGVYAYFRFVEKPENRKEIQRYLLDWYMKTHQDK